MRIRCHFFTLTTAKRVPLHDHQIPFLHTDTWKKTSLAWSSDAIFSPWQMKKEFSYMIIRCHFFTLTTGKRVPFDDHHEPLFYLDNWKNNSFVIITSHFFTLTTRKRVLLHDHQIPLFHTGNWKKISLTWSADSIFSPCQLEKESPYIIIRCHFFTQRTRKIVLLHDHQMPFRHPDNWKNNSLRLSSDAIFSPWLMEK